MSHRALQAVLRSLAAAEPPADDGELLRRFLGGDDRAFDGLVRRHGRLVWSACRHLTGSDAEADDAFQATFLVLLRGAGKVRDAGRLSAWLHGVAFRVCARARRAARRRAARERAAAAGERSGSAVPDSAWDRALAAVHEEVGALPETLRVPFVLCCLEGRGVTEAAAQLGWKLGTFSARLTRAKDALVARLDARGLTLGAAAGLGLATPPAAAVARAAALARVGSVVPGSVLQLAQGVTGMSATSFKVLATAVLLTGGLGVGAGWVAPAGAQPPARVSPPKADPRAGEAGRPAEAAESQSDPAGGVPPALTRERGEETHAARTAKWEYEFVAVGDVTRAKFVELLRDREGRGWEFNGTTPVRHDGQPSAVWVFRRPAKEAVTPGPATGNRLAPRATEPPLDRPQVPAPPATGSRFASRATERAPTPRSQNAAPGSAIPRDPAAWPDEAKATEAEIARLQEKLAALRGRPKPTGGRVAFPKGDLPLEPTEMMTLLGKLAERRFARGRYSMNASGHGLAVEGDQEVIDWFTARVQALSER